MSSHAELAGHVAGLVGEHLGADVVGCALRQPARAVAAVADDLAALGTQVEVVEVARLDREGALIERRRQAIVRVAVDRGGLSGALDQAAREELHDGRLQGAAPVAPAGPGRAPPGGARRSPSGCAR